LYTRIITCIHAVYTVGFKKNGATTIFLPPGCFLKIKKSTSLYTRIITCIHAVYTVGLKKKRGHNYFLTPGVVFFPVFEYHQKSVDTRIIANDTGHCKVVLFEHCQHFSKKKQ